MPHTICIEEKGKALFMLQAHAKLPAPRKHVEHKTFPVQKKVTDYMAGGRLFRPGATPDNSSSLEDEEEKEEEQKEGAGDSAVTRVTEAGMEIDPEKLNIITNEEEPSK